MRSLQGSPCDLLLVHSKSGLQQYSAKASQIDSGQQRLQRLQESLQGVVDLREAREELGESSRSGRRRLDH